MAKYIILFITIVFILGCVVVRLVCESRRSQYPGQRDVLRFKGDKLALPYKSEQSKYYKGDKE